MWRTKLDDARNINASNEQQLQKKRDHRFQVNRTVRPSALESSERAAGRALPAVAIDPRLRPCPRADTTHRQRFVIIRRAERIVVRSSPRFPRESTESRRSLHCSHVMRRERYRQPSGAATGVTCDVLQHEPPPRSCATNRPETSTSWGADRSALHRLVDRPDETIVRWTAMHFNAIGVAEHQPPSIAFKTLVLKPTSQQRSARPRRFLAPRSLRQSPSATDRPMRSLGHRTRLTPATGAAGIQRVRFSNSHRVAPDARPRLRGGSGCAGQRGGLAL